MEEEWSRPGFGWTSSADKVRLLGEYREFDLTDASKEIFPGSKGLDLLTSQVPSFPSSSCPAIQTLLHDTALAYLSSSAPFQSMLEEVMKTGKSNGRGLRWDLMDIPPNRSFRLHAHPNIEVVYVVHGVIHEFRMKGEPLDACLMPPEEAAGPPLSERGKDHFLHRHVAAGQALVNEVGSVHISFTREEGALLLCLWSGRHADIPLSGLPQQFDDLLAQTAAKSSHL